MLSDWRFWAGASGVAVLVGFLFPISLPVGPITAWLVLIALALVGYELGKRILP